MLSGSGFTHATYGMPAWDTSMTAFVELPSDEARPYEMTEVTELWRERVGEVPGVKELKSRRVAAGTHPGAGLPGVISSAEVLSQLVPDPALVRG